MHHFQPFFFERLLWKKKKNVTSSFPLRIQFFQCFSWKRNNARKKIRTMFNLTCVFEVKNASWKKKKRKRRARFSTKHRVGPTSSRGAKEHKERSWKNLQLVGCFQKQFLHLFDAGCWLLMPDPVRQILYHRCFSFASRRVRNSFKRLPSRQCARFKWPVNLFDSPPIRNQYPHLFSINNKSEWERRLLFPLLICRRRSREVVLVQANENRRYEFHLVT